MKQSVYCIVLTLGCVACNVWNGIILDSDVGNTELIFPNSVPNVLGNVNIALPHVSNGLAVSHPDGNIYFLGGYNSTFFFTHVIRFNPVTNTTTLAAPMTYGRSLSAATILGNTIIVCGGVFIL
jgi:hypothetical protein